MRIPTMRPACRAPPFFSAALSSVEAENTTQVIRKIHSCILLKENFNITLKCFLDLFGLEVLFHSSLPGNQCWKLDTLFNW